MPGVSFFGSRAGLGHFESNRFIMQHCYSGKIIVDCNDYLHFQQYPIQNYSTVNCKTVLKEVERNYRKMLGIDKKILTMAR